MGCCSMMVPNGLFVTRDEQGYYKVVHVPSGKKVGAKLYSTEMGAVRFARDLAAVGVDWYGTTNHLEKNTRVAECVERGTT